METPTPNGWSGYQRLVMAKLEQLDTDITLLDEKVTLLRIDVAQLKIKAGVWGATAGMVPALITSVIALTRGL